ncbi:MAG TPA: hypothetical protein EYQ14_07285 [Gammaproteobacteria bacterium]|nr:hypothetical protein [Gammaproteobacteria bacterium]HIL94809.1 hypothetical protein [Pseudomonadales bacterium]
MSEATVTSQLLDVPSKVMGTNVKVSVLLPPGFDTSQELPLLINLHGGGGDRMSLIGQAPLYQRMFEEQMLPPLVVVSFSSGPIGFYFGAWEQWVCEELPDWANKTFGTRTDRDHTLMTGISMGGYGSLKIGFKYPDRFRAIAPMEPAIMPILEWPEQFMRPSWFLPEASIESIWTSHQEFLDDNPANIVVQKADEIRSSGMEIYLEVGDEDHINLHDGAEFLHRILWDNDIRHDYHLVRWADHVGVSMERRIYEAHTFLGAAMKGGLSEPIDLPLTSEEQTFADYQFSGAAERGEPAPEFDMMSDPYRAPSIHAALWKPLRELAHGDTNMKRAYGILPDSK